jgi:hypothetical protein
LITSQEKEPSNEEKMNDSAPSSVVAEQSGMPTSVGGFVDRSSIGQADVGSVVSDLPRADEPEDAPDAGHKDKSSDEAYQAKMRATLGDAYRFLDSCAADIVTGIRLDKETRDSITRHASRVYSIDPLTLNPINQHLRRLVVMTLQTCAGTRNILTFGTHLA